MIQNFSIQVLPVNTPESYALIDKAIEIIKRSGLNYNVTAFATHVEGELSALQRIIEDIQTTLFESGLEEVILNIQIHAKSTSDVLMAHKTHKHR